MGEPGRASQAYAFLALLVFNAMPFIVGDQPQGVENLNPAEALKAVSTSGDASKQLILAGIYGSAMLLLLRMPFRLIGYLGVPTLLLTGWCAASALWSVDPGISVRRVVALLGVIALGSYLALRFDLRRMLPLMLAVAVPILLGSVLLAGAMPSLGLDAEGRMRGVYAHKNHFGAFAALSLLVAVALLQAGVGSRRVRVAAWLLLPLAVGCLLAARSTSVLPVLFAALTALALARAVRSASPGTLAWIPFATGLGLVLTGLAVSNSGAIAELLGKDADASGRTLVWEFALRMIAVRPWLGYGFEAFWAGGSSPGAVFWATTHLGVPHAHNGYVQLALNAGVIGLGLFLLVLAAQAAKLAWLLRHSEDRLMPFCAGFLAFFLVYNLSESLMWVGNEFLPLIFVYLVLRLNIAIRQQAEAAALPPGPQLAFPFAPLGSRP